VDESATGSANFLVQNAFRFCPACGSELPGPPPVTCTACGARHWLNAKPGAGAMVVRDGRLLLVRRAHDPWRGLWCAPGGFCEPDEHPADAAVRETLEETGLATRVTGYLGVWISRYDDDWISVAYYHAVPEGDAGEPGAEVDDVRWFDPSQLPSEVAPPGTFERVLAAWGRAFADGRTETPLDDR
jgi:8-oxo-dGTP diphosphatase